MSLQVEKLEKNMAKLTIEVSADELEKHFRTHTRNRKIKSVCQDSVKEKFRVRWLRRCMEQMYSMKMQRML